MDEAHITKLVDELESGKPMSDKRKAYIKKVIDMQDTINYNFYESEDANKKSLLLKKKVDTEFSPDQMYRIRLEKTIAGSNLIGSPIAKRAAKTMDEAAGKIAYKKFM
jgi:hypothetical protein